MREVPEVFKTQLFDGGKGGGDYRTITFLFWEEIASTSCHVRAIINGLQGSVG